MKEPVWHIRGKKLPHIQARVAGTAQNAVPGYMTSLLKNKPQDNPVYQFMDKKRAEGKPYLVYMTAGANKFLRIYYGIVSKHLDFLEQQSAADANQNP